MSNLTDELRARVLTLLQTIGVKVTDDENIELIAQGASGRWIMRVRGVIAIVWTNDRADNASFIPAALGLAASGIAVPRLLAQWQDEVGNGACLVTDLGSQDLLSSKEASWEQRRELYRLAFESLLPLYALSPDWEMQPPFDASLYGWEQQYFATHYLHRHLGRADLADGFALQRVCRELVEDLSSLPRMPIHRDCQSQNIMIQEGKAYLIDFQGMRMGRYEYDLASLIFDPYMDFSWEERLELLSLWEEMSGLPVDRALLAACGMQRLMQALGAYANIGYNQGKDWYLSMIPSAQRAIHQLADIAPDGCLAKQLYTCLLAHDII